MAGPGSEIWVQTGVHKPTTGADRTASFTLASNVAIYGGFTGNETQREQRNWETNITVLSGDIGLAGEHSDDSFHIVSCSGLEATTILDGFTIRDSYANANAPDNSGGGMYNSHCNTTLSNLTFSHNAAYTGGGMYNNVSSPTLTNVVFVDNWANNGGGMYNDNNSPTLVDVTFSTNRASSAGGGMYNSSSNPTLSNVTFYENQAEAGGGMANATSNPYLVGVTFSNNTASGYGGGVYNVANSSPTLTNTLIIGNVSTYGGGIYNDASVPFLRNVQFSGNKAYDSGGGMENNNSSNAMLYNVTFAGNSAGFGGGLYNNGSYPTLYNGILWGNTPEQILNSEIPSFDVIYYSIIQDGCPAGSDCSHVIDLNPQFFRAPSPGSDGTWGTPDDDYGDLRLQLTSPGIDAGMNAVVPVDITTDLLGLPRFVDVFSIFDTGSGTSPIVDMGAYEAQAVVVYLPTLLK